MTAHETVMEKLLFDAKGHFNPLPSSVEVSLREVNCDLPVSEVNQTVPFKQLLHTIANQSGSNLMKIKQQVEPDRSEVPWRSKVKKGGGGRVGGVKVGKISTRRGWEIRERVCLCV